MLGGAQVAESHAEPATTVIETGTITDSEHQVVLAKNSLLHRCFKRKPLEVVHAEEDEGVLERTLGFWDLFALGFGGTVGRFGPLPFGGERQWYSNLLACGSRGSLV